jgi:hypothetical protein
MVVVDEQLQQYQPRPENLKSYEQNGDPIPVVYMPRKPRKNGFLVHILG